MVCPVYGGRFRADRGQSNVASLGIVTSFSFEMVEKPADVRRGDGIEFEGFNGDRECRGQILQQHSPRVAIGVNRVARQVTLVVSEDGEVGLQAGGQGGHDRPPSVFSGMGSSRPAARAMSSPVADRYQYVWAASECPSHVASSDSTRSGSPSWA